jgi:protein-arginine kinase activator protein McsA
MTSTISTETRKSNIGVMAKLEKIIMRRPMLICENGVAQISAQRWQPAQRASAPVAAGEKLLDKRHGCGSAAWRSQCIKLYHVCNGCGISWRGVAAVAAAGCNQLAYL